ncbi:MAG: glycosyltransferase family 2 protein [Candidatus Magasanikbacteria bacterium]|jgi:glycosyltransferase involved in cell wall biosynthesis|nr:glycosyltransferase family 2 protein [Candidatus Magasanikbacteria bacterium]MBT4071959.1 glycosyltransferase family 2 protein [Candidatus Magasanikbacteria bacterium]
MKKNLVSLIIPVYNQKTLVLQRVIAAIEKQTYQDIEIIMVDDGSTDPLKSRDLVFNINMHITMHRQENAGAPAARNKGFLLSQGEYILFLDADVVCTPDMIEIMVESIEKEQADFVYGNFYFPNGKLCIAKPFSIEKLKQINYIHSSSMIKRESVIVWDESLKRFQDWDYWLTQAEEGKVGYWIDDILFKTIDYGIISSWLPSMAYKKPWKYLPYIAPRVRAYEQAKAIVYKKHNIT